MKVHLSGVLLLGSIAFLHAQYEKNVGINISTPTATLHLKGKGADNTTQSLKIENSAGTNLLTVNDDGTASGSVLANLGGGNNGKNALVKTTPESAGNNCSNGGLKIETGLDNDGNGTLDASEITDTRYICNGSNGQGFSSGSAGGQVYLTSATSPYAPQTPKTVTGDLSITESGAATIAANAITTAKLANQSVTIGKISATGTPGSTTFLRGDGTWAAAGGGSSSSIPFKKITMTTGNNYYTVTTADLGGILLFDWAAIQGNNTGTINLTLPDPATAGNGVKFKISYTSFQGGTNWACNARTPSGSMYAGNSVAPANTYVSVYFTSEFFCDGTNWYEIPEN
ncbi:MULTISPECIES: DUF7151 family protein [Chryseobacterium]|uniref:DUF7151 domain-containing protein n=1 Tax=Chryseobacterium camelliae TaxID=1265445 RepID=A0ABU0TH51_9FLAO|nr:MULTISPECIES: hypothetical protein [Chryseobacterium]MDT3405817.1 hypothetical protein [Pseudacidovorax intermedius]MDQ1096377.1 hypothetical protein [Chryseobacterium camelliae]MDQ1100316.1 hypothetical protein [Chryseobacterium sp. SORGH_AS_1048]MDR6087659.1 hypothetical protein [Chryseobacterium sp. SORGH_AS_0909]MDR6132033.1 hypothetical protein [Chryseobacterium sp. SORGH_AS_1175]